jgi:formate hydrogenlyase transcriptional activator
MFDTGGCRAGWNSEVSVMDRSAVKKGHLNAVSRSGNGICGIIGSSPVIKSVLDQIAVVARTDSTVLIQGETGTGKELIARALHKLSPRRDAPLITLSCAAVPAGLLESELFGHERGAFTGALTQRRGRFEIASGGTLFLDEIGDIALDLQAKLLRVLQEKEFERLGSSVSHRADVRLIAATNCDLLQMIEDHRFRADLYYRISVFPISLPPLRERPEDIPELVWHFVAKFSEHMNKPVLAVSPETMAAMVSYSWPGNVRELQNVVERGVIISQGPIFQLDLDQLQDRRTSHSSSARTLDDATRDHILRTLDGANWVIGGRHGAASRLGIPRTTLIAKMRRLGIEGRRSVTHDAAA